MITRVVADVVHDKPLNDRQRADLASATSEFARAVGMAGIEVKVDHDDNYAVAHQHVSTEDERCRTCMLHSRDERH